MADSIAGRRVGLKKGRLHAGRCSARIIGALGCAAQPKNWFGRSDGALLSPL